MRVLKTAWFALFLLLAAPFGLLMEPAVAGDAAAGKVKARDVCQICHGEDGVAVLPGAANLSGQQKEYLREQLRAYRSGSRRDPQMNVIAKPLTDADIENLAEWYSGIKITIEMPK
ncbi:MAG: cytochrome c [Candidatus Rokuibacteriota bacterium]